jgi:hypothetical protein
MKEIFKKGDEVYDISYGWGFVEQIRTDGSMYPILVNFRKGCMRKAYTSDGKTYIGLQPVLSFTDYSGEEPFSQERPKFIPKKGDWVWVGIDDYNLMLRRFLKMDGENYVCFVKQNARIDRNGLVCSWPNCIPYDQFPPKN